MYIKLQSFGDSVTNFHDEDSSMSLNMLARKTVTQQNVTLKESKSKSKSKRKIQSISSLKYMQLKSLYLFSSVRII